jgi:Ca2+-binding EF-hand superfamily protein
MWGGGGGGFIARLDANGNGMLDPEESQGRARMFLDRTGLDLSRPIPMDQVTRAFDEMRNRMSEGMGGNWPGGGRGENRDESGTARIEVQPLVPGFGEPDMFEPVLGFGDLGEKLAVKIEEQDMQRAQSTMGQSDTNRDGMLDADEIRNGRWRGNDPLQTDRNRDGKLSLNELALRYAVLRSEQGGGDANNRAGSDGNRSGGNRGGGAAGDSQSRDGQNRMVEMIFGRYDRNGNGVLEKDEWGSFQSDPSGYDTNRDGKITREEFAAAMASRFGGRGGEGGGGGWYSRRDGGDEQVGARSGGNGEKASGTASSSSKKSYRLRTAAERMAALKDLPDWFSRADEDGDGQVRMSEYSSSWSDSVVADFAQFDLNKDGIVTPAECLKATESGAVQGAGGSSSSDSGDSRRDRDRGRESRRGEARPEKSSSDSEERAPASAAATEGGDGKPVEDAATATTTGPESRDTSAPAATGDVPAKVVKYAVGFIKRYDSNSDGVLTRDEWASLNTDYSPADADKDGRITPLELGVHFNNKR